MINNKAATIQNPVTLLLKLLLFWIIFFFTQQVMFLAVNYASLHASFTEVLVSFAKALPMNLTAAAYLMALPSLFIIAGLFGMPARTVNAFVKWETIVMIVVCAALASGDMGLYKVWGTKINTKALGYLQYPGEVLPTVFAVENLGLVLLIASQVLFALWLRTRLSDRFLKPEAQVWKKAVLSVLAIGLCVLGFRGGFQRVPINRNWVFHSKHSILNYGALNGFWNFADLLAHPLDPQKNPYTFFDEAESEKITSQLHEVMQDSTMKILNTTKPNIVIVFLESWAADVIGCLGGEADVTPKFTSLSEEGLLFTEFYSTGFRTEQGYLATFSATPALPVGSVVQSFGSFDKLPNLYRTFNDLDYHTSFYTGGRLFFDNIESYLRAAGVKTMKGENEWNITKRTVWGAYDEETFAMHLDELKSTPQPFFSVVSTMTTHEWFDADVPKIFTRDADDVNDKYRNTMHYADSCLFAYIRQAQKQPWYQNTLFVIMADHACKFPRNRNNYEKERHHIPLLMMGGALQKQHRGRRFDKVASHVDIASTLLAQLGQPSPEFPYSKNIFNRYAPEFAYYAFDNGFGMIGKNKNLVYDHNQRKCISTDCRDTIWLKHWEKAGQAYLETQYTDKIRYASMRAKN